MTAKKDTPAIVTVKCLPYLVSDLEHFQNSQGEMLPTHRVIALCRCGHSEDKPFCDGTHADIGFVGDKDPDRVPDVLDTYEGNELAILDNRGVCAHKGACTDNLPNVFIPYDVRKGKAWINPDAATVKAIIDTIEQCPSGALSYRIGSRRYADLDRAPSITVSKDGPFEVVGRIRLKDDLDSKPESEEHYCLSRCGASLNKPFCDGSHHDIEFTDEKK
jgi:CDGSH-type Zn-finger protein